MKKYVILPSNNDLNRGDQALIWETVRLAKEAGYLGEYYILAENESLTKQSQAHGLKVITPILKHPGRKSKIKDNSSYSMSLIIKWGIVAGVDFVKSVLLLNPFTKKIGIKLLSEEELFALKTIRESEICFVKGGGFIHSSGKITDPYTVYYSLFHVKLAQSFNKNIYVMPNSFGPFKGIGIKRMVKNIIGKCKLVTVRESISSKMLDEIGVEHKQFPDLGFFLEKNSKDNNEVSCIREEFKDYKLVGITARPYRFPNSDNPAEKYDKYIDSMKEFCKWLYANRFLPVFIEHTLSENTHENDGTAISDITDYLNRGEYTIISNDNYTSKDLKAIYSNLDYVVGTRFHSVIFSLSEGTPSIAITYGGNKGQGIMKDIGLQEYAISIERVNYDELVEKFIELDKDRVNYRERLKNYLNSARDRRKELIELIIRESDHYNLNERECKHE